MKTIKTIAFFLLIFPVFYALEYSFRFGLERLFMLSGFWIFFLFSVSLAISAGFTAFIISQLMKLIEFNKVIRIIGIVLIIIQAITVIIVDTVGIWKHIYYSIGLIQSLVMNVLVLAFGGGFIWGAFYEEV